MAGLAKVIAARAYGHRLRIRVVSPHLSPSCSARGGQRQRCSLARDPSRSRQAKLLWGPHFEAANCETPTPVFRLPALISDVAADAVAVRFRGGRLRRWLGRWVVRLRPGIGWVGLLPVGLPGLGCRTCGWLGA
jgi:hypothetical protein